MLDNKDLQSISKLLDKKLDTKFDQKFKEQDTKLDRRFKDQDSKLDKKFDEVLTAVSDGFTEMQKEFDALKEEVKLRPTLEHIMNWGDEKIVAIEVRTDKLDYLHINELDNLPPQPEISQALVEHGLKKKTV